MNAIILNLDVIKRELNKEEKELYTQLDNECKDKGIDLKLVITQVLKGGKNIFNVQSEELIECNLDYLLREVYDVKLKHEIIYMTKLMNEYLKEVM